MKDSFNNIVQKTNEFNILLEDVLNSIPDSAKNYKLKKKIEASYRMVKLALERHEDLITDAVPKLKNKTDDYPKEFIDTWNIYKDFLVEQFGIRIRSRMQMFRLKLLFELTDNDFNKATKWLQYYMAAGSASIYPVNEFDIKENKKDEQKRQAGFTLPTKSKN